ncbi:LysR family transcriptional regulator [Piscinibacter sakaiensis]|uniref:LysR family transcriptional regulator PA2758 n=1 Tax=Piscinibacter sakaiensis TaxID=1547922 RepID=A0A0K8NUA0_PISS1|nr:LysR family transcriptional regulator [Piscinibacter sakaiensis]GAP33943.1 LysR family transcriptional regulator PA2758 [Piscinibacter sakaiensis]
MAFTSDTVALFLAVLDHGSFSAAARALGRVPSAVSMAVANLEAELGLALFDRQGREPRPTAAARALEPQARQLAAQQAALTAHALALTLGLEQRLSLAIAPELLSAPWTAPLAALARAHPLLDVEVLAAPQADALAMLHTGRAQLALVFERPRLDGREGFREVGRETLVAVVAPGHPLLGAGAPPEGPGEAELQAARQIVVAGRDAGVADPRLIFARHLWHTDSPEAACALLEAGLGWGWLPRGLVRERLAAGRLRELPLQTLSNAMTLWVDVVWSRERPLGLGARQLIEGMVAAGTGADAPGAMPDGGASR